MTRWLPAVAETSFVRRTALGVAGLAFVGGAVAGPASHAFASPAEQTASAMTTVAVVSADSKPAMDKLSPHGTQGAQSHITLSKDQLANAKAITDTAKKLGMGERGAVIAVATSMQESKLENLGHLGDMNDHDSLGLFQQRPSSGWGSPEQITDPVYASTAFLKGLKQVDGWQDMPLTDAAQKVQVSAFPDAYAQWEDQAAHIVQDVWTK
ncbi:hypothetical protein ACI2K4_05630 [Micromonospora sp. NPDC050397]|uniref:hypothetical protein n=1 Tax=Micromonospora sp. NPDC050397 TaxID=3364279 RepID=UPI003851668B